MLWVKLTVSVVKIIDRAKSYCSAWGMVKHDGRPAYIQTWRVETPNDSDYTERTCS
jgi:hypothetical protein